MRIIGIDIGGTTIKIGMFDENGDIIQLKEYDTNGHLGGDSVLKNLIDHIGEFDNFDAIGISVAGQIDPKNGVIVMGSVNIPGMDGMKIKEILEKEFQVPVAIENDVNAAALGENQFGKGRDYADFLFLTYGTGIGGAIVLDSQIHYGEHAFAGEFGHMMTHAFGRSCNCGLQGCYERYASTTALIKDAQKVNKDFINGKILFEKWHLGDVEAIAVVANWVDEIVVGLINLVHIFNPSTIIVGGGVMEQDVLIQMIEEKVNERILPSFREVTILKASLGNKAGMLGGVSLHV